jgi:hypothetical protein
VEREKFIKLSKYVEFWKQGIKIKHNFMQWRWIYIWIIGKMFCCICSKPLPTQRSILFGRHLAFQQLDVELCESWVAIHKADCWFKRPSHLSFIVGPRTWNYLSHTPHLKISTMKILFLWNLMILSLSLFRLEEHILMLWKMIKMIFSKWWGFSGGEKRVKFGWMMFIWRLLEQ